MSKKGGAPQKGRVGAVKPRRAQAQFAVKEGAFHTRPSEATAFAKKFYEQYGEAMSTLANE